MDVVVVYRRDWKILIYFLAMFTFLSGVEMNSRQRSLAVYLNPTLPIGLLLMVRNHRLQHFWR